MSETINIRLREVSKRLLFRYYPIFLFTSIMSWVVTASYFLDPIEALMVLFIGVHIALFCIYTMIIIALSIFKNTTGIVRIMVIVITMLLSATIIHAVDCLFHNLHPIPFSSSGISTMWFLKIVSLGILIVWFFCLEERQYISDKKLIAERTKRILEEKRTTESMVRLLKAQIEPHFMFNTMTSILSLSDSDPQKAKTMQKNFIRYLKKTFVKTRAEVNTIGQEIELIQAYLDIFKVRMGKRLHYTIDVADAIKDSPFPSMLIQPVVENAIKHGLEPEIGGGEIHIKVTEKTNALCWEISDTGRGFSEDAGLGTGLSNVMERIESLYGHAGKVMLEENLPSGLKVSVEVPYV